MIAPRAAKEMRYQLLLLHHLHCVEVGLGVFAMHQSETFASFRTQYSSSSNNSSSSSVQWVYIRLEEAEGLSRSGIQVVQSEKHSWCLPTKNSSEKVEKNWV